MSEHPKPPQFRIPKPVSVGAGAPVSGVGASGGAGGRPGVLSLTIKDKQALYAAYMPYVKGGGVFVPSNRHYKLGEEVFLLLTLVDVKEKIPVAGRVVWVTPPGAQGGRIAGIGVQFSEKDSGAARAKIENILAGTLSSDRTTHTM